MLYAITLLAAATVGNPVIRNSARWAEMDKGNFLAPGHNASYTAMDGLPADFTCVPYYLLTCIPCTHRRSRGARSTPMIAGGRTTMATTTSRPSATSTSPSVR